MTLTRQFAEAYEDLGPRDLVHFAVMKNHGISEIITADTGFDKVDWVRQIDLL